MCHAPTEILTITPVGAILSEAEPYHFTQEIEYALVYYSACRPSFYAAYTRFVDPSRLSDPVASKALGHIKALAAQKLHGAGPRSLATVKQHLKTLFESEGKLQRSDFLAIIDGPLSPDPDSLISEPELKATIHDTIRLDHSRAVVDRAILSFQNDQGLEGLRRDLDKVETIGVEEEDRTVDASTGWDVIMNTPDKEGFLTGIEFLDYPDLTLPRGKLGFAMAGTGDGKSTFLTHISGTCVIRGLRVAYASFELDSETVAARVYSGLVKVPFESILGDKQRWVPECKKKFDAKGYSGNFYVRQFSSGEHKFSHVDDWVQSLEADTGTEIDCVIVDYADLLAPRGNNADSSSYAAGGDIYKDLTNYATRTNKWVWTASQRQRKKNGKGESKLATMNDIATSMRKGEIAHFAFSINRGDDPESFILHIMKNRTGRSFITSQEMTYRMEYGLLTERKL